MLAFNDHDDRLCAQLFNQRICHLAGQTFLNLWALGKTFWLTVLLFVGLAALFGVLSVLALFLAEAGIVVGVLVTVLYLTVVRLVRAYVGYALLEEAKKTCADLSE